MAISNKRFLLGGALAGLADAFYANGGMQPQAMGQFIARDDMMREKDEEDQRRRAMQQALMGAVNEMDPSHLRASVNPIMGRATPELAAGQGTRMSAARRLMANPDTMGMGFEMAMQQPQRRAPIVAKPGEVAFDPDTGKELFSVPGVQPRKMVYNVDTGRGYALIEGSEQYNKALDSGKYTLDKPNESGGARNVQLYNPDTNQYLWATPDEANEAAKSGFVPASERARGGPKQYTQDQYQAAGFAQRMAEAERIMGDLEAQGYNPSSYLEAARGLTTTTASNARLKYEQAMRDWVRAKLRKESGATIGDEEMASEIKTYFGEPGAGGVNQQKADARRRAQSAMVFSSGGAFDDLIKQTPRSNSGMIGSPTPGTVEDGYRFKGGNPADPNNWERM